MGRNQSWQPWEVKQIHAHKGVRKLIQIALPHRSSRAISEKCRELGYYYKPQKWTREMEQELVDVVFPKADKFGISRQEICNHLYSMAKRSYKNPSLLKATQEKKSHVVWEELNEDE
ncbi:hypothetical protein [Atopobium fossor]|uniref:hypothetical protein n=1 Tax=Atopobium fossor TaxID=39487 RepID=UPI000487190B|nr:hypothetical protein [Atopobium fossor]